MSGFRTFNDVPAFEFRQGVSIHAVGGDQVLVCRVSYDPGFGVGLHSHEHTEQVMVMLDGDLTMTIAGETKTIGPGDTVVVNRGVEHELRTEGGCTFIEALAPVPLDHVPDPDRDLVLGDLAGSTHVAM
jgi:quercetin dioxygenase-like cupin family protein